MLHLVARLLSRRHVGVSRTAKIMIPCTSCHPTQSYRLIVMIGDPIFHRDSSRSPPRDAFRRHESAIIDIASGSLSIRIAIRTRRVYPRFRAFLYVLSAGRGSDVASLTALMLFA